MVEEKKRSTADPRGASGRRRPHPLGPGEREAPRARLGGALRSAGRVVLWALIALLLVRGLGDLLQGDGARLPAPPAQADGAFPDDAARAVALGFARTYIESPSPGALRPYLSPEVLERLTGQRIRRGPPVAQATIAGIRPLAPERAIVTVACQLERSAATLHLAVPLARDPSGRLSVFGLPAFVAPPPPGQAAPEEPAPLSGPEPAQIRELVERFLRAYLSDGDASELDYLLAPGAAIAPLGGGLRLVEPIDIGQLGAARAARLMVLAQASVRESESGATYPVAYRLQLVRRERWYVARVEGALR